MVESDRQKNKGAPDKIISDKLIANFDKAIELRKDLEEDWDFQWVLRLVFIALEANDCALEGFRSGVLDTVNHKVQVVEEMIATRRIQRVVIDGKAVL